jgi:hypothetical protein
MRRALTALAATTCLALTTSAHALAPAETIRASGSFGIGVGGGTAVGGLSLKYFPTTDTSFQVVVGGAGYANNDFGDTALGVDLDFLLELPTLATAQDLFELGWEAGLGAWTWIGDPFWLGVNGAAGLQLNFLPVPIDLVLEWRPAIRIVPDIGVELVDFGGHLRFYFR